jgi:hypothetical protein
MGRTYLTVIVTILTAVVTILTAVNLALRRLPRGALDEISDASRDAAARPADRKAVREADEAFAVSELLPLSRAGEACVVDVKARPWARQR